MLKLIMIKYAEDQYIIFHIIRSAIPTYIYYYHSKKFNLSLFHASFT